MKYGGFWHNIKRATTYLRRPRGKDGARHFSRTDARSSLFGAQRRPPPGTARQFVSLVVPALLVTVFGLLVMSAYHTGPRYFSYGWKSLLFGFLTVVCMARAATAHAPAWVRVTAFAASLAYPVGLLLM